MKTKILVNKKTFDISNTCKLCNDLDKLLLCSTLPITICKDNIVNIPNNLHNEDIKNIVEKKEDYWFIELIIRSQRWQLITKLKGILWENSDEIINNILHIKFFFTEKLNKYLEKDVLIHDKDHHLTWQFKENFGDIRRWKKIKEYESFFYHLEEKFTTFSKDFWGKVEEMDKSLIWVIMYENEIKSSFQIYIWYCFDKQQTLCEDWVDRPFFIWPLYKISKETDTVFKTQEECLAFIKGKVNWLDNIK